MPADRTLPRMTSSTSADAQPARRTASRTTIAPRSTAGNEASAPRNFPIGVRQAESIRASGIKQVRIVALSTVSSVTEIIGQTVVCNEDDVGGSGRIPLYTEDKS